MRHILLHYHIFKNAGSTIDAILKRNFGSHWEAFDRAAPASRISAMELKEYARVHKELVAISSHQLHLPQPVDSEIIFYPILFLRHPLDRIASVYYFTRAQPKAITRIQKAASEKDLPEFIKWCLDRPTNIVVSNFQTAVLANTTESLEGSKLTATDLRLAIQRIKELPFLGLVELFDESLVQMQQYLYDAFGHLNLNYTVENKNHHRKHMLNERLNEMENVLGVSLFQELLEKNAMDLELYQTAVMLFNKRVLASRDQIIRETDKILATKEQIILEREKIIAQQKSTLDAITEEKIVSQNTLNAVLNSNAWKIITRGQKLLRWFIPIGSVQEKFFFKFLKKILQVVRYLRLEQNNGSR